MNAQRSFAALALTAILALASSTAHADPTAAAPADQALQLYTEGVADVKAGQLQQGYEKLRQSFDLKPSLDTAANLAIVEDALERFADAANHMAYAIRLSPSSIPQAQREKMQALVDRLAPKLALITFECPAATLVTVNGNTIGNCPLPARYVDPGSIEIVAKHADLGTVSLTLTANAGDNLTAKLNPQRTVDTPAEERPIWPAILLGIGAAAGLGMMIGGVVVSTQNTSSADDRIANLRAAGDSCLTARGECASADAEYRDANVFLAVGIAGAGIAAASLAGLLAYLFIPKGDTKPAVTFAPLVAPTTLGLAIAGDLP